MVFVTKNTLYLFVDSSIHGTRVTTSLWLLREMIAREETKKTAVVSNDLFFTLKIRKKLKLEIS